MFVFAEEWQLLLSESRLILNANVDHSISQHIPTGLGHAFVVYLPCHLEMAQGLALSGGELSCFFVLFSPTCDTHVTSLGR